jgi:glycine cleavage system H lipoate-binding protein
VDGADTVTIGMDDFARKLVGRLDALNLPKPGDRLTQGEPAWTLMAGSTPIGMLSPVDGTVVAVNDEARAHPGLVHQDPYEKGWLLKLKSPRLAVNLKHLLSGSLARSWMNGVTDALRLKTGPELGLAYEDGGVPVDGFARSLDSRRWDAVAREFLLTDEGGPHA